MEKCDFRQFLAYVLQNLHNPKNFLWFLELRGEQNRNF